MLFIDFFVTLKTKDIGVGNICKFTRRKSFNHLPDIPFKVFFLRIHVTTACAVVFVAEIMLTHYHIIERIIREKIAKPCKIFRIILRLNADVYVDIFFIFVAEGCQRLHIPFKLLRPHTEMRIIIAVENIRAVV